MKTITSLLLLFCVSLPVCAQSEDSTITLSEVVVNAAKVINKADVHARPSAAVEVVRAVCCVVSQLCRVSCGLISSPSQPGFTAPVLAALEAARVLEEVLAGLRSQAERQRQ